MNKCAKISEEMGEELTVHWFDMELKGLTPRDRKCKCCEHTWGEMGDLLTLHEMWERS